MDSSLLLLDDPPPKVRRITSMKKFVSAIQSRGLRAALDERGAPFGDYCTSEPRDDD